MQTQTQMLATLQRDLQQRYTWIKSLRPHPADEATLQTTQDDSEREAATAPSSDAPQRLRLQIVVDHYQLRRNALLLDELGQWSQQHQFSLEPCILTEQESQQLSALGAIDESTPLSVMRAYRAMPDYPDNAKRQLDRALDELKRILHDLGQEFPTSGLHAWNVGLHLQSLYQHITAWGLAVFDEETTGTDRDWDRFIELFRSYHGVLHEVECRHFPIQLQAFLSRQQQLASLAPKSYGDNDEEIEQLLLPLEVAVKAMRHCAQQKLVRPEDVERRVAIIWWMIMASSILGICGLLAFHFVNRPVIHGAVALPKHGVPGGIDGYYYKGKNFGKKFGKRLDRKISLRWHGSPMRGVPADGFSVEWKGYFFTDRDGKHRICSRHDDGARIFIGKTKLIDDWKSGWARTRCKHINLQRGWHPVHIQFFEKRKVAEIIFKIQKPGQKKAVAVESKHLCCKFPKKKKKK